MSFPLALVISVQPCFIELLLHHCHALSKGSYSCYLCFYFVLAYSFISDTRRPPFIIFRPICHPHRPLLHVHDTFPLLIFGWKKIVIFLFNLIFHFVITWNACTSGKCNITYITCIIMFQACLSTGANSDGIDLMCSYMSPYIMVISLASLLE